MAGRLAGPLPSRRKKCRTAEPVAFIFSFRKGWAMGGTPRCSVCSSFTYTFFCSTCMQLAQLLPPTIQTGPVDQFDQASHFACHRSACPGSFCCSLGTKLRNPSNHEGIVHASRATLCCNELVIFLVLEHFLSIWLCNSQTVLQEKTFIAT